jgi:hypothetical protein
MSDLKLAPEREKSVMPAVLIAVFVLAAIAAAVFYYNPHKVADLTAVKTVPFAPHTTYGALDATRSGGMKVLGTSETQGEDDLYLITTISMTDRLRIPIYLSSATAHVTFADGSQADASMIPASDVKRLQSIFPTIGPMIGNPLPDLAEFDPGQTQTGTFVFGFPGRTAQSWQTKKQASLTLELRNQDPQTINLP